MVTGGAVVRLYLSINASVVTPNRIDVQWEGSGTIIATEKNKSSKSQRMLLIPKDKSQGIWQIQER